MREIIFRGKRVDNGEWVCGSLIGNIVQPAADVVEVVRCKDCEHQEDCMKQLVFWRRDHVLEQNTYVYHDLDFCSYGERKEG